jgi:hypothetical protein
MNNHTGTRANQKDAIMIGVFFIVATLAAIIGLKLYDPILNNPEYLTSGIVKSGNIIWGAIFESILAFTALGTAILMFPFLRKHNEGWGLGYVCFRLLEVVFILAGIVCMLSIVVLNKEYMDSTNADVQSFQTSARILKTIKDWTFVFGPHFMLGINTFIYSLIFFQSKLVPRKLSFLGMAGAILIFSAAILEMFGIISQYSGEIIIMALPIALYEMILAVWLIVKGFNQKSNEQKAKY